jgi:exopolyphosphatase/guanosine-5'-triphosphate,3'-diphosphate pyrophosphatase
MCELHPAPVLLHSLNKCPRRELLFAQAIEVFGLSEVTTLAPDRGKGPALSPPRGRAVGARRGPGGVYAALDLGTNNCRLLVARPTADGFRVIDAFSRIVRLGEGLSLTGRLSEQAIARTVEALRICRDKMAARGVTRARTIATEACRSAVNGAEFVDQVRDRLGIELEIVDRETEARLAAAGAGDLADRDARSIVMFDIGGGSSEIVWLGVDARSGRVGRVQAWESLRLGVVSLAEKFGGVDVREEVFVAMQAHVAEALVSFVAKVAHETRCERFHLLGTSGTVTTIAGVHLNLPRYDRRAVDGLWLVRAEVDHAVARLRAMTYAERVANACIGRERADLVLAGCAILEAIRDRFPAERLRIADRGLREGILTQMMREDGVGPHRRMRPR